MTNKENIVILGCGFVGMITALSLAKRGIKTVVFESQSIDQLTASKDERNIAITHTAKKWLLLNGIWFLLEPYIAKIKDVYVIDNKDDNSILQLNSNSSDGIGYMIMSNVLQTCLLDLVLSNPLITLSTSSPYLDVLSESDSSTILFQNKEHITADLLLVCDGKNSLTTTKHSRYFIQKDYNQKALVFRVKHSKAHENCAVEHFLPTGVFAILPTINQFESSVVWIQNCNVADSLLEKSTDEILPIITDIFGPFLGALAFNSKILSYQIKASLVKNYFYNRIVFLGDCAHVIHPLAGQGLNQGIKDIISIVEIISKLHFLGLEVRQEYLMEYQKTRFIDNLAMFLLTESLEKLFVNNSSSLSFLRKTGLKIIQSSSIVKNAICRYSMDQSII